MRAHDFRRLALAHELLTRAVPPAPVPTRQTMPCDPSAWPPALSAGVVSRDPAAAGLGFEPSVPALPKAALALI